MKNKIKQLRDARGWSMADLAQRLNTSISSVNRLEKAGKGMRVTDVLRLAEIFGVTPGDIVPDLAAPRDEPRGLEEDAKPYQANSEMGPLPMPDNRYALTVTTDALDAIGIERGDTIFVDISEQAVRDVGTGDAVVVQAYGPDLTAKTLLRQFVEPEMLITNSRSHNAPPLYRDRDDCVIKGVIVTRLQSVRRRT